MVSLLDVPPLRLLEIKELGEWSRKIIEVYMTWYTFFGASNVAALGWIYGTDVKPSIRKVLPWLSILFCALNLLGTATTLYVGFAVGANGPQEYAGLIRYAAYANSCALTGFAVVWIVAWRKIRWT